MPLRIQVCLAWCKVLDRFRNLWSKSLLAQSSLITSYLMLSIIFKFYQLYRILVLPLLGFPWVFWRVSCRAISYTSFVQCYFPLANDLEAFFVFPTSFSILITLPGNPAKFLAGSGGETCSAPERSHEISFSAVWLLGAWGIGVVNVCKNWCIYWLLSLPSQMESNKVDRSTVSQSFCNIFVV